MYSNGQFVDMSKYLMGMRLPWMVSLQNTSADARLQFLSDSYDDAEVSCSVQTEIRTQLLRVDRLCAPETQQTLTAFPCFKIDN